MDLFANDRRSSLSVQDDQKLMIMIAWVRLEIRRLFTLYPHVLFIDFTAKTNKESMGLSSDISVTVVHKKKIDVGGTSSSGPKISVKKESELLVSIFIIYSSYVVE